ncbi:DUF2875 family protein [Chitinivorax sp. B]|uniref:type VI lipase adapter Tla3 domain-containing protein n=1 Tax=Chitinivorax sp. B TaxID=2502235 RepID=UPI0010FA07E9|nr:DUF2875 family protein [Chitinivorax sp. B]
MKRMDTWLMGGLTVMLVLIAILLVNEAIQFNEADGWEPMMNNRLLWGAVGLALMLGSVAAWRWRTPAQKAAETPTAVTAQAQQRDYVLEIIGLGVTLDKYRQSALWETLAKGNAYVTIREQNPEKYPWTDLDKIGVGGGRQGDSLENGAKRLPMNWVAPLFNTGPLIRNPAHMETPDLPETGFGSSVESSGMAWTLFATGPRRWADRPDRILDEVFAFFDTNPDVPYIVLTTQDDADEQDNAAPPGTPPLLRDGHYVTAVPDASALFVLARRERVDRLRPFVFEEKDYAFQDGDHDHPGPARKLFLDYIQLQQSVPHPRKKRTDGGDTFSQRNPTIEEWLPFAAKFAKRPDLRESVVSALNPLDTPRIPSNWQPTPWFPIPWNTFQLQTFDALPTLGYLHRPTWVKLTDAEGKPLTRRDDRVKAMLDGWQQALTTLPEAERKTGPARVIVGTGDKTDQLLMLHGMLNQYHSQGGPAYDPAKANQFIDTDKRLGNTGAATWFMQMAIGTMGSYLEGGPSAAINLRDENEASIMMITPPSEAKRKQQGTAVWAHKGTPMIDPANYQQP